MNHDGQGANNFNFVATFVMLPYDCVVHFVTTIEFLIIPKKSILAV